MTEKNLFFPFHGKFAERIFALAGVENQIKMVGVYVTVTAYDGGYTAKICSVHHIVEKKGSKDMEVFMLKLSGDLTIRLYPKNICRIRNADNHQMQVTSLSLGMENRILCSSDGKLK